MNTESAKIISRKILDVRVDMSALSTLDLLSPVRSRWALWNQDGAASFHDEQDQPDVNPRGKHRTHFVPFPLNLTQIFGHTDGDPSPRGRDGVCAGSEDLRNHLPSRKVNDSYRGCATSGTVQRRTWHLPIWTHPLQTTSRRRQRGIV